MAFVKISEQSSLYNDLEKKSVHEILEDINTEDHKVADAVKLAIPQIEKLVTGIVKRMKKGGRIFYIGAGTSGRLGVLDASEIPPTFGMDPGWVIGLIAGGDIALRNPVENAEDDTAQGWKDLEKYNINEKDTVIGIAASGTTPYVIGALKEARQRGLLTAAITSNSDAPVSEVAEIPIAYEIRYRTKDDLQHDHYVGDDSDGSREGQQDGEHAAHQRETRGPRHSHGVGRTRLALRRG